MNQKIKNAKYTIPVSIVTSIAAHEQKNAGAYEIKYASGIKYIGKGSPQRMYVSAVYHGLRNKDIPVEFNYERTKDNTSAFIREYEMMVEAGYHHEPRLFYNKIWSPGRLYYFAENKGSLYLDDEFGLLYRR